MIVLIQPWESWMAAECVLEARDQTEKKVIPHRVEPAGSGVFRLSFDDTAEVKRVFESGHAEVRAIDRQGKVLGSRRIAKYRGRSPIALKLRIVRPSSDRAPVPEQDGRTPSSAMQQCISSRGILPGSNASDSAPHVLHAGSSRRFMN